MATKRQIFYSFHYDRDNARASQVRNIGVVEGNRPAPDNDWESVTRGGEDAIKRWIAEQMQYRSCTFVLVGTHTANRKWINYEIVKSWSDGMGVAGICIHGLKNFDQKISCPGLNPFDFISFRNTGTKLSSVVKCYNPPGSSSKERYGWIAQHIGAIADDAVNIRGKYEYCS